MANPKLPKDLIVLKGKAVIGQSGGCTAVINRSLAGVADESRSSKAITHLWGMRHGIKGLLNQDFIDLKAQPPSLLHAVSRTPSSALGSCRHRLSDEDLVLIVRNIRKQNIRYVFMIGGNDTAETLLKISQTAENAGYDLRAIHIPKTIDNDLMETDHTPGYGSVARFAAITTQEAGMDTRAMRYVDPVKIIELMGRNSGWIVAASALLKKSETDPPHLLLFPEEPFYEARFLKYVDQVLRKVGYCVVVISETIRDSIGNRIGVRKEGVIRDGFGHPYVEGAAGYLAQLVEKHFKVRARYDKPGTIQRMAMPYVSDTDQREAYAAGIWGVRWALAGHSKVMVSFVRVPSKNYRIQYRPAALEKIPGRERYLPPAFLNRERTGVSDAFRRYALPLLGGRLPDYPLLEGVRPKGFAK